MKSNTNKRVLVGSGLALAMAMAVWAPVQAQSSDPADTAKPGQAQTMDHCREIKAAKLLLTADIKTQDEQLTAQLSTMNNAPEDKKVGLMAATLTLLVEQRISTNARRATMEESMMKHMMGHMQAGKDSMPHCPMMGGTDEKSGTGMDRHPDGK